MPFGINSVDDEWVFFLGKFLVFHSDIARDDTRVDVGNGRFAFGWRNITGEWVGQFVVKLLDRVPVFV